MLRPLSRLVRHVQTQFFSGTRISGLAVARIRSPWPSNHTSVYCSIWSTPPPHCHQWRWFRGSAIARGLEEFFPLTDNPVEEGERSGRPWLARELRHKSSEDLHKLWYVLLKERNMLITIRQEANRLLFVMPGPERLRKVRRSMARIKLVLFERERAQKEAKRLMEQPIGGREVAESADAKKIKRPKSYKILKLIRKKRIRRVKDYRLVRKVEKKRRNVRNYKHIKVVRELERREAGS